MKKSLDCSYMGRKLKRFLIAFALLLLSMCCKDKPTKPPDEIIKNPREYTWTIDTISYPGSYQTLMQDVHANSPDDVYIVGFNDRMIGNIYHYDGISWHPVPIVEYVGGPIEGGINLSSVYCFYRNNVWAVGGRIFDNPTPPPAYVDSSLIIQYDGVKWKEYKVYGGNNLSSIWGADPTSIWTVGMFGTVYYYDGIKWGKKTIRDDISFKSIKGTSSSDIYVIGYKLDTMPYDSITCYIFHFNGYQWELQDSLINFYPTQNYFGVSMINVIGGTDIYSVGNGIFKKGGGNWSKVYDDGTIISGIGGNVSNNIFAVGEGIRHFNGIDWFRYPQFKDHYITIWRVWADKNEVFAVGNDGLKTYVFHGR